MSYKTNIIEDAEDNSFFRRVLYTGELSQLVVMDLKPGEDIGKEVHDYVEQTIFILSGEGRVIIDDDEVGLSAGDVVVISPGSEHNVVNDGDSSMKIYTVYTPPNHIDGKIHETKDDAEMDTEDEEFGRTAGAPLGLLDGGEDGGGAVISAIVKGVDEEDEDEDDPLTDKDLEKLDDEEKEDDDDDDDAF